MGNDEKICTLLTKIDHKMSHALAILHSIDAHIILQLPASEERDELYRATEETMLSIINILAATETRADV